MEDFGKLGSGYAHGYIPDYNYILTINNIFVTGYSKAKYEVKIHYTGSWDDIYFVNGKDVQQFALQFNLKYQI